MCLNITSRCLPPTTTFGCHPQADVTRIANPLQEGLEVSDDESAASVPGMSDLTNAGKSAVGQVQGISVGMGNKAAEALEGVRCGILFAGRLGGLFRSVCCRW